MTQNLSSTRSADELSLAAILRATRRGRRTIIFITTGFALFGALVAWLQIPVYRASVVFSLVSPPFSDESGLLSQTGALGAIGRIAGISLSGGRSELAVNLEILRSAELTGSFLQSHDLLEEIHANWASWRFMSGPKSSVPLRKTVEYFQERVRAVKPTTTPGIYQLEIDWKDPIISAQWANAFLEFANSKLRDDAAARAEKRLEFLRGRLASESVTQVRESIGHLIAEELKGLALTTDVDAYAFLAIDPAVAPLRRVKPRRALIVLLAAVSGCIAGVSFVLARDSLRGLLHA